MSNNTDLISNLVQLNCILQVVLHKLDDIQAQQGNKQELKQRVNVFGTFIERRVESMTKQMDINEGDTYNALVKEIEDLVNTIVVVKE